MLCGILCAADDFWTLCPEVRRVWGAPQQAFLWATGHAKIAGVGTPALLAETCNPENGTKNGGPYSGTSVSLAFLMPSAVASITTSSFSFIEFRSTSMCFLQELVCAPPSA